MEVDYGKHLFLLLLLLLPPLLLLYLLHLLLQHARELLVQDTTLEPRLLVATRRETQEAIEDHQGDD
jgi:hypothetical protein